MYIFHAYLFYYERKICAVCSAYNVLSFIVAQPNFGVRTLEVWGGVVGGGGVDCL